MLRYKNRGCDVLGVNLRYSYIDICYHTPGTELRLLKIRCSSDGFLVWYYMQFNSYVIRPGLLSQ